MIVHLLPKNEIFSIGNTLQGTGSGQEKLLKIGKEVEPLAVGTRRPLSAVRSPSPTASFTAGSITL